MEEKLIPTFSVREFSDFLAENFDDEVADSFKQNKISGSLFLKLSEDQLGRMVQAIGDVVNLTSLQSRIKEMNTPTVQVGKNGKHGLVNYTLVSLVCLFVAQCQWCRLRGMLFSHSKW